MNCGAVMHMTGGHHVTDCPAYEAPAVDDIEAVEYVNTAWPPEKPAPLDPHPAPHAIFGVPVMVDDVPRCPLLPGGRPCYLQPGHQGPCAPW